MTAKILVIGGTGTVGSPAVDHLVTAGSDVRIVSRGRRQGRADVEHFIGDIRSGDGLDRAIAGVDTVLICAHPAGRVVAAARRAGVSHLVYTSIVGIEQLPLSYYRRKLGDEWLIAESGMPFTVLRATQFHDLVAAILRMLAKPPVMILPAAVRFQPVDVRDVGAQLAALALAEPVGRAPDFGGPEARSLKDLARSYLSIVGVRRRVASIRLPGKAIRAFRDGANLAPEHASGVITFEQYLTEQFSAGCLPYADAIRGYLRKPGKEKH